MDIEGQTPGERGFFPSHLAAPEGSFLLLLLLLTKVNTACTSLATPCEIPTEATWAPCTESNDAGGERRRLRGLIAVRAVADEGRRAAPRQGDGAVWDLPAPLARSPAPIQLHHG